MGFAVFSSSNRLGGTEPLDSNPPPTRILAHSDDITRTAQHLGFVVVLEESLALSSYDSRTTFSRSPRGSAPRAARGRDWLGSRPHAEELKELLCCDRGRAARPRELRGKGRRRGGECGPVSRKREEKPEGAQGRDGKGGKGKELAQAETPASGVWGRLGAANAETLLGPAGEDSWFPERNLAAVGGVEERDRREVRDELLTKNRKGGGWQRCASAKFGNWRRGAERSLTEGPGGKSASK